MGSPKEEDLVSKLKDRRKFFEGTSRQLNACNESSMIIKKIENP